MWFSDTTIRKLLAQKREVCQNANRTATPVKQQEVVSNVFYHDLQPVFIVLRFIGCFPIQNKGTGVFVFAKCSMLYLVTFLHYVAYLALSLYFSQDAALLFGKKDRQFDDMVYDSIRLIYFTSPHLHLITFLCKSKQIAAYLRHWYELEMLFFKTTGNYLVLKQRRNTLIMMFLAPILVFVSGAQQHFLFRGLSPWHKLTFCYSVFLNIYVDITWILICWSLTAASQAYNKELKIVLSDSSCFLLHTLRRYRGLWLQLCRLIEETGNVLCYQYIFHLLGCIVMLTLCLYAFLSGLLDGCLNLKHLGFGTMTTMFLVQKYLIINSAHEVMEQAGHVVEDQLQEYQLRELDDQTHLEIQIFVCTVHYRQPSISLGNYVVINRAIITSLVGTLVTYLVVLVQFKVGQQAQSNSNYQNVTDFDKLT